MKFKFKGTYCWYGELHTLWTTSSSYAEAHKFFQRRLCFILGRSYKVVGCYFAQDKDLYRIQKILKKEKRNGNTI